MFCKHISDCGNKWFFLSGWLCSISFCQNRKVFSIFFGLLKKGQSLLGDVERLLVPDTGPFLWGSNLHALWHQLWYLFPWQELKHLYWTSCSCRVPGVGHFCKIDYVVFPRTVSLVMVGTHMKFLFSHSTIFSLWWDIHHLWTDIQLVLGFQYMWIQLRGMLWSVRSRYGHPIG